MVLPACCCHTFDAGPSFHLPHHCHSLHLFVRQFADETKTQESTGKRQVLVRADILMKSLFISFKEKHRVFASAKMSLFIRVSQTPLSSIPATIKTKHVIFKQRFSYSKPFLEITKNMEDPNGTKSRRK
jgi:hypothetical protein